MLKRWAVISAIAVAFLLGYFGANRHATVEGQSVPKSGAAYTAETIKPFVSNFYCGAEVVENRYADVTKVSGPGRIVRDAARIIRTPK